MLQTVIVAAVLGASVACHPGPIASAPAISAGGTIAGNVAATGGTVAVAGRKVTATDARTRTTYDATTSVTGGYTIKVPEGTYRLDVELRPGEALTKRPDETQVNNGDLDPGRDFEITVASPR
jgi:hypothetical protein